MNNLIEIKNVSKIYEDNKKNKILNKVNFTFKKGKIYSLVGPSGSGKSTLLNLLSLIIEKFCVPLLILSISIY